MGERKIDGKEISLIARKYFEDVLKTPYLYFETIKVTFNKENDIWNVEVEIQPLYTTQKKRYKLEISGDGEVKNVEQISTSAKS